MPVFWQEELGSKFGYFGLVPSTKQFLFWSENFLYIQTLLLRLLIIHIQISHNNTKKS